MGGPPWCRGEELSAPLWPSARASAAETVVIVATRVVVHLDRERVGAEEIPIIKMLRDLDLFCDILPTKNHILVAGLCFIALTALLFYLFCEAIYLRDLEEERNVTEEKNKKDSGKVGTAKVDWRQFWEARC